MGPVSFLCLSFRASSKPAFYHQPLSRSFARHSTRATLPVSSLVAFLSVIEHRVGVSKVRLRFPTFAFSPVKPGTAQLNSWAAFWVAGASPGDSPKQQNCLLRLSIMQGSYCLLSHPPPSMRFNSNVNCIKHVSVLP